MKSELMSGAATPITASTKKQKRALWANGVVVTSFLNRGYFCLETITITFFSFLDKKREKKEVDDHNKGK